MIRKYCLVKRNAVLVHGHANHQIDKDLRSDPWMNKFPVPSPENKSPRTSTRRLRKASLSGLLAEFTAVSVPLNRSVSSRSPGMVVSTSKIRLSDAGNVGASKAKIAFHGFCSRNVRRRLCQARLIYVSESEHPTADMSDYLLSGNGNTGDSYIVQIACENLFYT